MGYRGNRLRNFSYREMARERVPETKGERIQNCRCILSTNEAWRSTLFARRVVNGEGMVRRRDRNDDVESDVEAPAKSIVVGRGFAPWVFISWHAATLVARRRRDWRRRESGSSLLASTRDWKRSGSRLKVLR